MGRGGGRQEREIECKLIEYLDFFFKVEMYVRVAHSAKHHFDFIEVGKVSPSFLLFIFNLYF